MNDASLAKVFGRPLFVHLLGAGLFVGLFTSVGYLVVLPLRESNLAAAHEVQQLTSTVRKNRSTFAELEQLRQEFAKTEERADAIRERIPGSRQEAEVLENLSRLAQRHHLEIVDYRRGGVSDGEQFSRVQIDLQCQGSFHAICYFINAVAKLERLTSIDKLQIQTTADEQHYPVAMSIALYYRNGDATTAMTSPSSLTTKVVTR